MKKKTKQSGNGSDVLKIRKSTKKKIMRTIQIGATVALVTATPAILYGCSSKGV